MYSRMVKINLSSEDNRLLKLKGTELMLECSIKVQ